MDIPDHIRRKMHTTLAPLDEYADAVRAVLPRTEAETQHLIAVIAALDFPQLCVVAETNYDPMPWAPFLNTIIAIRQSMDDARAQAAEDHCRALARGMLDWQGLQLIAPNDVLRAPPALAHHVLTGLDIILTNSTTSA